MAYGQLEFITSASTASGNTLDITDCFNADYDIYMIKSYFNCSSENASRFRVIDTSGTVQTGALYTYAEQGIMSATADGQNKTTGTTGYNNIAVVESNYGANAISYLFNPYVSGVYPFMISQSISMYVNGVTVTTGGFKFIGAWQGGSQIAGIQLSEQNGIASVLEMKVYGIK